MVKIYAEDLKEYLKMLKLKVVDEIKNLKDDELIEFKEAQKLITKYYTPETALMMISAFDFD